MNSPAPRLPCYLVEWYQPEFTVDHLDGIAAKLDESAASMGVNGSPVQRLMTLAVPGDEVVFGVFTANSERDVAEACIRAGIPAQRLTAAVEDRIARPRYRETPDSSPTISS